VLLLTDDHASILASGGANGAMRAGAGDSEGAVTVVVTAPSELVVL